MPIKRTLWQIERFIIYRVLHADDSPHRIALGIALGLFIAWTPTVGIQMMLVLAAATLLRANKLVGVPLVWISNPLTIVPIYFFNYCLGRYILSLFLERPSHSYEEVKAIVTKIAHTGIIEQLFSLQAWHEAFSVLLKVSGELWIGSVIIGLILAVPCYFVSYHGIIWYRAHRPHFRLRRKSQDESKSDPESPNE
ncbi:MAG: DUF2062 domain-containing protein [Sedimentisphaerales bacterium]|nr:DUF2062 domain-containing protein [Sedimentisphaerales bacterium]